MSPSAFIQTWDWHHPKRTVVDFTQLLITYYWIANNIERLHTIKSVFISLNLGIRQFSKLPSLFEFEMSNVL